MNENNLVMERDNDPSRTIIRRYMYKHYEMRLSDFICRNCKFLNLIPILNDD